MRKTMKRLTIKKESISTVAGSEWHRTTLRCHQSLNETWCEPGSYCTITCNVTYCDNYCSGYC